MARLKVALCITDLDVGGAERALVDLCTRLDREQFEPVVYCLGPRPDRDEASCVPPLERAGVEVHCLNARGLRDTLPVVRRLTRLLRQQSPDLLQTFLFHANLLGRWAARRASVRRVVCGLRVAERHSHWHLWLDRLTTRWVDRYACVSEAVARFSAQFGGLRPETLVVIPNGVDLGQFPARPARLSPPLPPGRRIVTFAGRLEPQKGAQWLIETAPRWLARATNHDLLVAGSGPEGPKLEQLCQDLGIADRVHFLGWRPDLAAVLAASDILVLPSQWEGMPNVVLQAMASRLPVLASDVEGVCELLGPAAVEQTVPYGQSEAFSSRILEILSDPVLAADLGRRNRLAPSRRSQSSGWSRRTRISGDPWSTPSLRRTLGLRPAPVPHEPQAKLGHSPTDRPTHLPAFGGQEFPKTAVTSRQ